MKRDKTALANAGKKISNLYAFFLAVRWSAWLLRQIPQVEKAWAAFLQTPSGQTLQVMFGASLGWKFCVDILLGPYGLLLFALGCSAFWGANHFPVYRWVNLTNTIRSALQKPQGQKVANRFYLRVFQGNREGIFDLGKRSEVQIKHSPITVSWRDGTASVSWNENYICDLPADEPVSLSKDGEITTQTDAFVTLQFIPFQAMILVPNQRR